ncbi:ABC transporter permease [Candidatus Saccharibacteria bacterium]|nr:ABC transporter permease [Candidatus Saccharibacteria bacterium]
MSSKTIQVAKYEIVRQLKKPAFWAATLLIPALIGVLYFIVFVSSNGVNTEPKFDENTKIAISDEAGILSGQVPYLTTESKEQNIEKLEKGELDLYYVIPKDFPENKKAEFYHISEGLEVFNNDGAILKRILSQDVSARVDDLDALVLTGEYEVTDHKLAKDGTDANVLGKAIIPLFVGAVFFMFVALCGNRFLLTVVEEKENRISEMILTSISSKHLIVGKIVALLILGLVQITVLVVPILVMVFLNRDQGFLASILGMIEVDPLAVTLSIILFVASAVFYAGMCTFVGALVSTARDASSFIGPAIIAMVLPLYFMQMFMATEPNTIVQVFTYFPITAPIALMLRNGFGTISVPEFCIGTSIVIVSAVVAIRLAVKTFQKNAINFGVAKPKFMRKR